MSKELDKLVQDARTAHGLYMKALRTHNSPTIMDAARNYHQMFDRVKVETKWSLTKLFAVINDGESY